MKKTPFTLCGSVLAGVMCLVAVPIQAQVYYNPFDSIGDYSATDWTGTTFTQMAGIGVNDTGGLSVTGGDGNTIYKTTGWDFSQAGTVIWASIMLHSTAAVSATAPSFQFGFVANPALAGFAGNSSGNGQDFASFRLNLTNLTFPSTFQLQAQTTANGTAVSTTVSGNHLLTVGNWYQFSVFLTNTSPGVSFDIASSLIDYGVDGLTSGASVFTTATTLRTITGAQAAFSGGSAYVAFRSGLSAGNSKGVDYVDELNVYVQPVPEPQVWTLLGLSALLVTGRWRSK